MAQRPTTSIIRTAYATSEPDEAREFLEGAYGASLRVGADNGEPWEVSLRQTQAGPVTVAELDMPPDLSFEMTGQGDYIFTSMIRGTSEREDREDVERFGGGELFLAVDPEEDSHYQARRAHTRTISLDGSLLDELRPGDSAGRWRFTERRAIAGGARRWNEAVALLEGILADPEESTSTLVLGPASRILAATALTIFPNSHLDEPQPVEGRDGHPDTLRRAIAFIESNPSRDITIAEVGRAAYATPRTVQLAFRRHLGTTPMAYLRRVRLDLAHAELLNASPDDGATVARIALDWGFASPSRFAGYYRVAYGRAPSETLAA